MSDTANIVRRLTPITIMLSVSLLLGSSWAAPSVFPENAAYFSAGYNGSLGVVAGGEYVVETPFVDTSVDAALYADLNAAFGARLSGTALVFPAIGTEPPLALGLGADIDVNNGGAGFHIGPVLGSDLLFVFDLPMTVSTYIAPGYASDAGFDLAWALQVRYYFDTFALELASTDVLPLSVGLRYLF